MTVFLSFKMLWYLLVSDSSYLINQSIFLKLSIFSWPFSCLWRSAICSDLREGRVCLLENAALWARWQCPGRLSTVGDLLLEISESEHSLPYMEETKSGVELGN